MSIKRRQNWLGQQRVDIPHLKSLESAVSNDFDDLLGGLVIGKDNSLVVRGMTINMPGAIGGAASGLQLLVEDSAFLHGSSDESGTFYTIDPGTDPEVLNSTTNEKVEGSFTPNTENYVGLEFVRSPEDSTADQVYFWNPTTDIEFTRTVPLAIILDYKIVISTSSFASNIMPIAVVETDSSNNVVSIEDRRGLLFRLASAGDAEPNPFYEYPWDEGREENFYKSTSSLSDPFAGGDKQISNMKEFFDAFMTEMKLIKGTSYWYSEGIGGSIAKLRQDIANTAFSGRGSVVHGTVDFKGQVAGMTTDVIIKTSAISAEGPITLVQNGSDIDTLISNWNAANPDDQILLYSGDGSQIPTANIILTSKEGQINWTSDIFINFIGGRLSYKLAINEETDDVVITDNQVAYIKLVRNEDVDPNLVFTNGSATVASVGAVDWTADLQAGDFIKNKAEFDDKYYEILTVDSPSQVTLVENFQEASSGASGFDAQYAFGTYESNPVPSTDRHIQIADRGSVPFGQDYFWLFFRADNGGSTAKAFIRVLGGTELEQGESQGISDNTSIDIINYIGSSGEFDNTPDYDTQATDTKDGNEHYNAVVSENLTERISRLTTMMADKAQDKTILLASDHTKITNTTNASAQEITMEGGTGTATVILPSSAANGTIGTTGTVSLNANQVAYYQVDRNATFSIANLGALTVSDISAAPLDEKTFIFAYRLADDTVYLWNNQWLGEGTLLDISLIRRNLNQNSNAKLIEGGTWSFASIPDLPNASYQPDSDFNSTAALQAGISNFEEQSDGKLIGVGFFSTYDGNPRTGIIRLNPDGTEDTTFYSNLTSFGSGAGFDNVINNILVLSDDSIILIGGFENLNGTSVGRIVKLDSDGNFDSSFGSNVGSGANNTLATIKQRPDNSIILAGSLTSFGGVSAPARLVKIDENGNIDSTWMGNNPSLSDSTAYMMDVLSDNQIIVGDVNGFSNSRVIKIDANGTEVTSFWNTIISTGDFSGLSISAEAIVTDSSDNVYVSLFFNSNFLNGSPRGRVLKFDAAGNEDATFLSNVGSGVVYSGAQVNFLVFDDLLVLGNNSVTVNGVNSTNGPTFLNSDGTVSSKYDDIDQLVSTLRDLTQLSNGNILASGFAGLMGIASTSFIQIELDVPTVTAVALSSDAYIQVPSLLDARNTISAQSFEINSGEVAYVEINRDSGATDVRSIVIDAIENLDLEKDEIFVIARKVSDGVLIGNHSFLLQAEDYLQLDGAKSEIDRRLDQLKVRPTETRSTRVIVDPSDIAQLNGSKLSLEQKNLLLSFDGAQIDFATGEVFEADGTTPFLAGANDFVPFTIPSGEYFYYSVSLLPNVANADNTISGQILVIPAANADASLATAPKAPFPGSGIKLANVYVQESGSGLEDIDYANIINLGVGGSGSGTGDANSDLTRYQDRLNIGLFEYANTNVAAVDEDDQVDGSSTASFDIPTGTFKFDENVADTLVSTQQLDSDFLAAESDIDKIELLAIWELDDIDTGATYEVSRDGGNEYQAVTMSRIGNSDLYRGIHEFDTEAANAFNQEYAVTNADGLSDLNDSTQLQLSQKFTTANSTVYKQVSVYINKNSASATGGLYVDVVRDDSGAPSTDPNDIVWSSVFQNINSLSVGDNAIDIPSQFALAPADYHIVFRTNQSYLDQFALNSSDKISVRIDSSAGPTPNLRTFNGTTWAAELAGSTIVYRLEGREQDLRVRITSSATADDKFLRSYAVLYGYNSTAEFTSPTFREIFTFDGTSDNLNEFTLTQFLPDSRFLMCFALGTGQTFRYGDFVLDGSKVIFPPNTFNIVGTVQLEFFQINSVNPGPASTVADSLLTANHLGSTDGAIDKSANGRGIFLRRPDGTLREITVDDNDNIVIYSV